MTVLTRRQSVGCALACLGLLAGPALAGKGWRDRLQRELAGLDQATAADLGVFVRELPGGASVSHRAGERWYLASMVKLPVAIAVLLGIERGEFTLATPLTLRASDAVDGAGPTQAQSIGTRLSVAQLLERMIVHSDNTASDMLIGLIGVERVNDLLQSVEPGGFGRVTSLGDVRRHVYAQLAPEAMQLGAAELRQLRMQRTDAARVELLGRMVRVPPHRFAAPDLAAAYAAYYATGLNSGRLDAYGTLLQRLAEGQLLDATHTTYLLDTMEHVVTGPRRLRSGLPAAVNLAHKTGTQRERTCDAGVVSVVGSSRRVVVVACVSGEPSLARAERVIAGVGEAVARSGVLATAEDR